MTHLSWYRPMAESKLSKIERLWHPLCIPKSMSEQYDWYRLYFYSFFAVLQGPSPGGRLFANLSGPLCGRLKSSQFCIISIVCLMVAYQMFECFFFRGNDRYLNSKNYRFINLLWPSGFKQYDKIRLNVPSLNYTYWSVGEGIIPYRVIPSRFGRHRQSGLPPFYWE